jgi:hypothetical protein
MKRNDVLKRIFHECLSKLRQPSPEPRPTLAESPHSTIACFERLKRRFFGGGGLDVDHIPFEDWEPISESDDEPEAPPSPPVRSSILSTRRPSDTPHGVHYRASSTRVLRPYEGQRPNKRHKLCTWEHACDTMKNGCGRDGSRYCKLNCLSQLRTSPDEILKVRAKFFDLGGEDDVSVWMARFFESSKKDNGHVRYHFGDGKEVCSKAWQKMYGISNGKMSAVHKRVTAGTPFPIRKPDSIGRLFSSSPLFIVRCLLVLSGIVSCCHAPFSDCHALSGPHPSKSPSRNLWIPTCVITVTR